MKVIAVVKGIVFQPLFLLIFNMVATAQPVHNIKQETRLVSQKTTGGMGVAVVWNKALKRYYAVVSGTGERWLYLYDEFGNSVKNPYQLPFDPGSLWLEGNGKILKSYASGMEGLYAIHLRDGMPAFAENIFYSLHNPIAIGNGAWAAKHRELWYYHDKTIFRYKTRHAHHRSPLHLDIEDFENEINSMGLVYTGIRHCEIGLYDRGQNRILLYSARNGKCQQILQIQDENGPKPLCGDFAYANGYFWLFNREAGIWHGYR